MRECDSNTFYGENYIHGRNTKYKDDYFGINVDVFDRLMTWLSVTSEPFTESYKTNSMMSFDETLIVHKREDGIVCLETEAEPWIKFKWKVDESLPKREDGMPNLFQSDEPTGKLRRSTKIAYEDLVELHAACHVELEKHIKMWESWWAKTPEEREVEIKKMKWNLNEPTEAAAGQDGIDGNVLCGKDDPGTEFEIPKPIFVSF
jgi:hypothetical protein